MADEIGRDHEKAATPTSKESEPSEVRPTEGAVWSPYELPQPPSDIAEQFSNVDVLKLLSEMARPSWPASPTDQLADDEIQARLSRLPLRRIRALETELSSRREMLIERFPALEEVRHGIPASPEERQLVGFDQVLSYLRLQIVRRGRKKKAQEPQQEPQSESNPFRSMTDLKWEEVTISFFSDEAVTIKARGESPKYTFAELGFKDGRKGDVPIKLWVLLRAFAQRGGEITWEPEEAAPQEFVKNMKPHVKRIRHLLKAFFGLETDPFLPYRRVRAYKTRFTLLDERGSSR